MRLPYKLCIVVLDYRCANQVSPFREVNHGAERRCRAAIFATAQGREVIETVCRGSAVDRSSVVSHSIALNTAINKYAYRYNAGGCIPRLP